MITSFSKQIYNITVFVSHSALQIMDDLETEASMNGSQVLEPTTLDSSKSTMRTAVEDLVHVSADVALYWSKVCVSALNKAVSFLNLLLLEIDEWPVSAKSKKCLSKALIFGYKLSTMGSCCNDA